VSRKLCGVKYAIKAQTVGMIRIFPRIFDHIHYLRLQPILRAQA